jgi:hypothetical protein
MRTERRLLPESLTLIYALVLCLCAVVYRLLPYLMTDPTQFVLSNFMPIGAIALFVGSRLRNRLAYLLPIAVMGISDLLLIVPLARLGFNAISWGTPVIYLSFLAYVALGRLVRSDESSPLVIGGAGLLGGLQFYLVTNFLVWAGSSMYAHTLQGLLTCYAMAVPFYRHTVVSDLCFSAVFFGLHAVLLWALSRRVSPAAESAA